MSACPAQDSLSLRAGQEWWTHCLWPHEVCVSRLLFRLQFLPRLSVWSFVVEHHLSDSPCPVFLSSGGPASGQQHTSCPYTPRWRTHLGAASPPCLGVHFIVSNKLEPSLGLGGAMLASSERKAAILGLRTADVYYESKRMRTSKPIAQLLFWNVCSCNGK